MAISARDLIVITDKESDEYSDVSGLFRYFSNGKNFKPVYDEIANANNIDDPTIFQESWRLYVRNMIKVQKTETVKDKIMVINYQKFRKIYESMPNKTSAEFKDFSKAFTTALDVCRDHNNQLIAAAEKQK